MNLQYLYENKFCYVFMVQIEGLSQQIEEIRLIIIKDKRGVRISFRHNWWMPWIEYGLDDDTILWEPPYFDHNDREHMPHITIQQKQQLQQLYLRALKVIPFI